MTNNDKTSLRNSVLDVVKSVDLPPASPLTQNPRRLVNLAAINSRPTPTAPVESKPVEPETTQLASEPLQNVKPVAKRVAPTTPNIKATRGAIPNQSTKKRVSFSYSFTEENSVLAESLAGIIGCKVDHLVKRICKDFDDRDLDFSDTKIQPRGGVVYRFQALISTDTIFAARTVLDPLGIRADGVILRPSVIALLDRLADAVLLELKEQFDA
jgi:hypothetical protein